MTSLSSLRSTTFVAIAYGTFLAGQFAQAAPTDVLNYTAPSPGGAPEKVRELSTGDYSVSTQTGAMQYSYAITVAPGRRGMQPSLALQYSSQGPVRGGVAAGWSMMIPEISVDVSDGILVQQNATFTQRWTSTMAGGQRLIPVVEPGAPGEDSYRAQHDTTFARYRKMPLGSAWEWEVRTTDGVLHKFSETSLAGDDTEWWRARLTSSEDPHGNRITYAWSAVYDPLPPYEVIDHRLTTIEYTSNDAASLLAHARIEFDYSLDAAALCGASGVHPGGQLEYREGARRVRGASQLDRVLTKVRDTQTSSWRTARIVTLDYDDTAMQCDRTHGPIRLLTSILETAYDPLGTPVSFPQVAFSYGPLVPSFGPSFEMDIPDVPVGNGIASGLRYADSRSPTLDEMLLDVDGDGRLDRVFSGASATCEIEWQRNNGGGFDVPNPLVSPNMLPWLSTGPQLDERCTLAGQFTFHQHTGVDPDICDEPIGSYQVFRFMDYNADGLPDLHTAVLYDQWYFDPDHPEIEASLGAIPSCVDEGGECLELDPDCMIVCDPSGACAPDPTRYDACVPTAVIVPCGAKYLECPDCDPGGGDPSMMCTTRQEFERCSKYPIWVYENLGDGQFASEPFVLLSPIPLDGQGSDSSVGGGKHGFSGSMHGFFDIDGDGYQDAIVRANTDEGTDLRYWEVFRGDGTGLFTGRGDLDAPYRWTAPTGLTVSRGSNYTSSDPRSRVWTSLMDLNGDGLADAIDYGGGAGHPSTTGDLQVFYNWGGGFTPDPLPIHDTLIFVGESETVATSWLGSTAKAAERHDRYRMLDFDGDGVIDMYDRYESAAAGTLPRIYFGTGDRLMDSPQTLAPSWNTELERHVQTDGGDFPTGNLLPSFNAWRLDTDVIDVNGDGLPDRVQFLDDGGDARLRVFPGAHNSQPARLLIGVDNGQGRTIDITYAPSVDSSVVEEQGRVMPKSVWVASSMTVNDGFGASDSVWSYQYRRPYYGQDLDGRYGFRGFEETIATGPRDAVTESTYGFDVDWSGRLTGTTVLRTDGTPANISETAWEPHTIFGGAVTTFHPGETLSWVCNQGATVATCKAGPVRRESTTWATLPAAGGYIATADVTIGQSTVNTDGDRRTSNSYEVRDTAGEYFVATSVQLDEERAGASWAVFGRTQRDYDAWGNEEFTHERIDSGMTNAVTERWFDATTGMITKLIRPAQAGTTDGTSYGYDDHWVFVDTETDAEGLTVFTYREVATGAVTATLGPNLIGCGFLCWNWYSEEWDVDGFGRPTVHRVDQDTGGAFVLREIGTIGYDDLSLPTRITTKSKVSYTGVDCDAGGICVTVEQDLNGAGQLIERRTQLDATNWATESYAYSHGDMVAYTAPDPSDDTGASTVTFTYSYDELGRPTGMRRPAPFDNSGVDILYDGHTTTRTDLVVDPGTGTPTTDGTGATTVTIADALGRLVTVMELDPVGGDATTTYDYDANDNITSIVDADGFETRLEHDYLSRRTAIVRNPGANERRWEYEYDHSGNMTAELSPRPVGQPAEDYTTRMYYDLIDRIERKEPAVRQLTADEQNRLNIGDTLYFYDDSTALARGRLHRVELPFGTVDYDYDGRGNVDGETRAFSLTHPFWTTITTSGSRSFTTTYNALNMPITVTHDDGTKEFFSTHAYRGLPRRAQIWNLSSWEDVGSLTLNPSGLVTRRDTEFSQHREVEYDQLGRPVVDEVWDDYRLVCWWSCWNSPTRRDWWNVSYHDSGDVATIASSAGTFSYGYDPRRQIQSATGPNSYTASFAYSGSGRILAADVSWTPTGVSVPPAHVRDVSYIYDETVADPDAVTELRRVSDGSAYAWYSYDVSGNAVQRSVEGSTWTHLYDGEDRLRRADRSGSEYYFYDHNEQRMLVVEPGSGDVRFTFGGLETTYSWSGSERERLLHVSLGGQPVARLKDSTTVELAYHAGRRDLLLALDTAGNILAGFTYGPFGEIVRTTGSSSGVDGHRRRFNDKEHDDHTGYAYYGYRYYDPVSLQWNRADPLLRFVPDLGAEDPRLQNLYAFSLNNPVAQYDPDGRCPFPQCKITGARQVASEAAKVDYGEAAIMALDIATDFVPGVGTAKDLVRGGIALAQGDVGEALGHFSSAGANIVPGGGTVAKIADKVNDARKSMKKTKKVANATTSTTGAGRRAARQPGAVPADQRAPKPSQKRKREVRQRNRDEHDGKLTCENCGRDDLIDPPQARGGQSKPSNQAEVDHKKRRADGGDNSPENLRVLCPECNAQ